MLQTNWAKKGSYFTKLRKGVKFQREKMGSNLKKRKGREKLTHQVQHHLPIAHLGRYGYQLHRSGQTTFARDEQRRGLDQIQQCPESPPSLQTRFDRVLLVHQQLIAPDCAAYDQQQSGQTAQHHLAARLHLHKSGYRPAEALHHGGSKRTN